MADNVTTNGYTTATDEIAGVHYQRTKIGLGADGTANDAVAGAGAVDTGTQRVTLASDDPAVTALQIMDDWDESDRAKVNPIAGQAGVAAGAGAVDALTQRNTLASDDPAVVALQIMDDWDESDRAKVNLIVGQAGIAGGTGVDGATVPRITLATDVALPAGENQIGDVGKPGTVVDVTLSLDTSAYADGDLLADIQEIANAVRENGGRATLRSIQLLDEDDVGCAMDLIFSDSATSIGTENAAADISDANARNILGVISIAAGDYVDLISNQIVTKEGLGLKLKAGAATTSLYIAAITRGSTPTYTASGVRLKLGLEWD